MACEIKLVSVEGVSQGPISCRVTLDKDTLPIEKNFIQAPSYGLLSLEFITEDSKNIGVKFHMDLLKNSNLQYIPLQRPICFIDDFPEQVSLPRVLVAHFPNKSTSRLESVFLQDDNMSKVIGEMFEQFEFSKQNLAKVEFGLKKKVLEMEYALEEQNKAYQREQEIKRLKEEEVEQEFQYVEKLRGAEKKVKDILIQEIKGERKEGEEVVQFMEKQRAQFSGVFENWVQIQIQNQREILEWFVKEIADLSRKNRILEQEKSELSVKFREVKIENYVVQAKKEILNTQIKGVFEYSDYTDLGRISGIKHSLKNIAIPKLAQIQKQNFASDCELKVKEKELKQAENKISNLTTTMIKQEKENIENLQLQKTLHKKQKNSLQCLLNQRLNWIKRMNKLLEKSTEDLQDKIQQNKRSEQQIKNRDQTIQKQADKIQKQRKNTQLLQSRLEQTQELLRQISEQILKGKQKLQFIQAQQIQSGNQIQQLTQQTLQTKNTNQNLKQQKQLLIQQNNELESKVKITAKLLSKAIQQISRLQNLTKMETEQIIGLNKEINQQYSHIEYQKKQLLYLTEISQTNSEKLATYQEKIQDLTHTNSSLNRHIFDLQEKESNSSKQIQVLEILLAQSQEQTKVTENRSQSAQNQVEQLKKRVSQLEYTQKALLDSQNNGSQILKELENLRSELRKTQKKVDKLEPYVELYEIQVIAKKQMQKSLSYSKEAYLSSQSRVQALQNTQKLLETTKKSLKVLQQKYDQQNSSSEVLSQQKSKLEQEISSLFQQLREKSHTISSLQSSLLGQKQSSAQLAQSLKEATICLQKEKQHSSSLQSQIYSLSKHNQNIQSIYDQSIRREHQISLELSQQKSALMSAQQQIISLSKQVTDLESQFSSLQSQSDQQQKSLNSKIKLQQVLIENQRLSIQQLTSSQSDYLQIAQQNISLKNEISQHLKNFSALQSQLSKSSQDKILAYKTLCEVLSNLGKTDCQNVDKLLNVYLAAYNYPNHFTKLGDGIYCCGNKKVGICVRNGALVVRVGGGYMYIQEFLKVHVPPEMEEILEKASTPTSKRFKACLVSDHCRSSRKSESKETGQPRFGHSLSPIVLCKSP